MASIDKVVALPADVQQLNSIDVDPVPGILLGSIANFRDKGLSR